MLARQLLVGFVAVIVPSTLLLGFVGSTPVHVVVAKDDQNRCVVVTVYVPDPKRWHSDWKTRRDEA